MTGTAAQSPRIGRLWPSILALLLLGGAERCMGDGTCLYQGEDGPGFLRIERLPDAHIVPMPAHSVTVQTKTGMRELIRVSNGDCKTVFYDLLRGSGNPETPRLVVETKDQSYYSVLLDHKFAPTMQTVTKVADKLGLEVVHERRRKLAYVIGANDDKPTGIEQFRGEPKWPEAREAKNVNSGLPELRYGRCVPFGIKKFPNGGILFVRDKFDDDNSVADDDNLYFDGVSIDELARYFEEDLRFPVVSQAKDKALYSFTLPDDICRRFSFDKTVRLPGLGFCVSPDEVEMEVIVVRDRPADNGGKRVRSGDRLKNGPYPKGR